MKAKKSLGQHWLRSASARESIIATAKLQAGDTILEIGPGEGFLTEALLATGARVIAVEKDDRLISDLEQKFQTEIERGKLKLIHDDVLNLDLDLGKYKLVANIPYYVTGQVLRKFLTGRQPVRIVLMLQNEVAKRIIARDGRESILSISVKAYGTPKYIKKVPAGAFTPPPKVDSAILLISDLRQLETREEQEFFQTIKLGFAHKRKLLTSNLQCSTELLAECKIKPKARAEELTLNQWQCLTSKLNPKSA